MAQFQNTSARRSSRTARFARTALLGAVSLAGLLASGAAQAACTPNNANPLGNITTAGTSVDCSGPNTGVTIGVNTDNVQIQVDGAGDTLVNSNITINGIDSNTVFQGGGTATNLNYIANGNGNQLLFDSGASSISTVILSGISANLTVGSAASLTMLPGTITLSSPVGLTNSLILQGNIVATGNNGGAFLLNGDTGNQDFNIFGTLTVQPNGLAIAAGDGDDRIRLRLGSTVNGGTGNNILFDGGAGNDSFEIHGAGTYAFTGANIERLVMVAGSGNTAILRGTGDYQAVTIGLGTVDVADATALGQSNSTVNILNGGTLLVNATGSQTFANGFLGNGNIRQLGQSITYSGNGAGFTGNFTIAGGTAIITSSTAFGTGTITNNSALAFNAITLANDISGTGNVTKTGGGVGILSGTNSYSGGTFVNGGTLRILNGGAVGTSAVNVGAGNVFELNFATDQTFANDITGAGSLLKTGAGIATLNGTNSYGGGTNIAAGGIRVDSFARLGSGPINSAAGTFLILDYNAPGQNVFGGIPLLGAGTFVKEGTGYIVLSAPNSYTGGTIIRNGTLALNNGGALGTGTIQIDAAGTLGIGGITLANDVTGSGVIRKTANNTANLTGNNLGFTGLIDVVDGAIEVSDGAALGSGAVSLTAGTVALLNVAGTTDVAASFTGGGQVLKLGTGTVNLLGSNAGFAGEWRVNAGTLGVADGAGLGGGVVNLASATSILDLNTATFVTLGNQIFGDGMVVKRGIGTVELTNLNSYSGGTNILEGALRVSNVSLLGTGPITVSAGAALDLNIAGADTLAVSVSGAGILRKSGVGDLTLLSNSLTGGIDITGGRLLVTGVAPLGTGPITSATDTQLVVTETGNAVLAPSFNGGGTLVKEGAGLLAINAANGYTGGTLVREGRLVANATGAFGTGVVLLSAGAELGLGGVTVGNDVMGLGAVYKTANNLGFLTGTNSHSGGTFIQGGVLEVNGPAALGSGTVDIGAGTALRVNYTGGVNAPLSNLLTGAGALVFNGTGTVVMNNGGNSFTGGTTIQSGQVNLNFGTALGTGAVVVNAGAALGVGDISFGNAVSGGGQILKLSSGTTTLTGTNTHSGGTTVAAGTLNVGSTAPLGTGTVTIANGATLAFGNSAATTFGNALSGAGTFAKSGTGMLTFANNFGIGALNLTAGRTRINTIATTNVTVGANATLDGTGRIIGNLSNGGIVAPGNSIGTLTVQGNYVHGATSVLEIEFDGSGNIDLLNVTGTATLNGGILRFVSIGAAEGSGGTFLTAAGGVTGTFSTIETVGAQLPLSVIYQPNSAIMAPSVLTARPSTFNAQALAAADTSLAFADSVAESTLRRPAGHSLWMEGFGSWGSRSASGTTLAYDHDSWGLAGGVNFDAGPGWTIGAAIGWADGDITLGSNGGGGQQSSLIGSLSARYTMERTSLAAGLLYGRVDQDTVRNVSFNGFSATVNGTTESTIWGGFTDVDAGLGSSGNWFFSLGARASYIHQSQDGYTEGGTSPLRLTVAGLDTDTVSGEAMLSATTSLWDGDQGGGESPEGVDLRIDLGGRYLGTLGDREIPVTFAASSAGITLQGDRRDALQGVAGVAIDYTMRSGASLFVAYRGEMGTSDRHTARVGLRIPF